MKLPRNAKIFRGQLDTAPFVSVVFLMLLFMIVNSDLVFNPGVRIELPESASIRPLAPIAGESVVVGIDSADRYYYDNSSISWDELVMSLKRAVQGSLEPLSLQIQADQSSEVQAAFRLMSVAGEIGFNGAWLVPKTRSLPPTKEGVVQ